MTRRPLRSALFPYTTLFRSHRVRLRLFRDSPLYVARAPATGADAGARRSEEHTSELQSLRHLVCRLLPEKKKVRVYAERLPFVAAALAVLAASQLRRQHVAL